MSAWTLEYNNIRKSFADWGLSNLKRLRINQAKDKVTFIHEAQSLNSIHLFDPGSSIKIFHHNIHWFQGILTTTPGFASSKKEYIHYEVMGPWWFLENLVYQQGWAHLHRLNDKEKQLIQVDTGRIILGQDTIGASLTNGEQIKNILNYAIEQGAPLQMGDIEVNVYFPFDETKDLSCAEAIQRLLRWSPDAIACFDYTTPPLPTLHILRRKNLRPSPLPLSGLQEISITPRYDLQTSAVVLKYEKHHHRSGDIWSSTEIDAYPATATGKEFKALVLTIELQGSRIQHIQQSVKTKPISINSPQWWREHLPPLGHIPATDISIKDTSRKSKLPFELIEGAICPWIDKKIEEDVIQAKISYKTSTESVIDRTFAIKLYATDAASDTYSKILSDVPADPSPPGLAQYLYEATNQLHFDGEITLAINTPSPLSPSINFPLDQLINIVGGHHSWTSMNALIQSIKENIDQNTVTIKFGPPKHLGPDDLIELLRLNRKRTAPKNTLRRLSGQFSSNNALALPTHSRIESTSANTGQFGKLEFTHPTRANRKIIMDASTLKNDLTIDLKEEDVCEDGLLKKRIVLASQTYERLLT